MIITTNKFFSSEFSLYNNKNKLYNKITIICIYLFYVLTITSLFLSNNMLQTEIIFLLCISSFFMNFLVNNINCMSNNNPCSRLKLLDSIFLNKIISSKSFVFFLIFITLLAIISILTPRLTFDWFLAILRFYFEILMFVYIGVWVLIKSKYLRDKVLTYIIIVVFINSAINLYQYIKVLPFMEAIYELPFTPTYGVSPDHYPTSGSSSYAIGCVLANAFFFREKIYKIKLFYLIASLIFFCCIILSQCRGSLLSVMIPTIVILYFENKKKWIFVLLTLLLIAFTLLLFPSLYHYLFDRGFSHRRELWKLFVQLALERPLFGYGERLEFYVMQTGHPHNIVFSAMIRAGIFAAISIFLMTLNGIFQSYYYYSNTKNPLSFMLILAMTIFGSVDYDLLLITPNWQWLSFWFPLTLSVYAELCNTDINTDQKV